MICGEGGGENSPAGFEWAAEEAGKIAAPQTGRGKDWGTLKDRAFHSARRLPAGEDSSVTALGRGEEKTSFKGFSDLYDSGSKPSSRACGEGGSPSYKSGSRLWLLDCARGVRQASAPAAQELASGGTIPGSPPERFRWGGGAFAADFRGYPASQQGGWSPPAPPRSAAQRSLGGVGLFPPAQPCPSKAALI